MLKDHTRDIDSDLGSGLKFKVGNDLTTTIANAAQAMSKRLTDISAHIKSESTRTEKVDDYYNTNDPKNDIHYDAYGRTKDKDDKDGVKALKDYLDRINKDIVDPLADAIGDLSFETKNLSEISDSDYYILRVSNATFAESTVTMINGITFNKPTSDDDESDGTIKTPVLTMLGGCKKALTNMLKQKQAMEMMNLANKQAKQLDVQASRLEGNGSGDYEAHKDAKLSMMGIVKANSIFARINTLNEKVVAKCCTLAAGLQSCVKANGTTTSK